MHYSQRQDVLTPTFESLEMEFDYQERKVRKTTRDHVEDALLNNPKHGKEKTKSYYEHALQLQKRCNTLIYLIDSLKYALNKKNRGDSVGSSETVKQLMIGAGMARELKTSINNTIDSFVVWIMDDTYPKELLKRLYPSTFAISSGWEKAHFSGTEAMAQMELSRLKNHLAYAEELSISRIIEKANSGCVFRFDQNYGIALARNTYLLPGDLFEASMFFAPKPDPDDYKVLDMELGGRKLVPVNGIGTYTTVATGNGLQSLDGKISVQNPQGYINSYPVMVCYMVVQALASVKADSGQIIYAGVPMPITVRVAGTAPKDIVVTTSGGSLSGSNDKYVITANETGRLILKVARRTEAGKLQPVDSTIFLVREK